MLTMNTLGSVVPWLFLSLAAASGQAGAEAGEKPLSWLQEHCLDFPSPFAEEVVVEEVCSVNRFESLGEIDGETLYYGLYRHVVTWGGEHYTGAGGAYDVPPSNNNAAAIFSVGGVEAGEKLLSPIWMDSAGGEIGGSWFGAPKIKTPEGVPLIVLPVRTSGTAGMVTFVVLARGGASTPEGATKSHGWQRVETESWSKDLLALVPPGETIRKGIRINFDTLRARATPYREGDPNCCASGDPIELRFTIERGRLLLLPREGKDTAPGAAQRPMR